MWPLGNIKFVPRRAINLFPTIDKETATPAGVGPAIRSPARSACSAVAAGRQACWYAVSQTSWKSFRHCAPRDAKLGRAQSGYGPLALPTLEAETERRPLLIIPAHSPRKPSNRNKRTTATTNRPIPVRSCTIPSSRSGPP